MFVCASAAGAQDAPPADSGATIRATASEVALDLVVRDKRGKQVKNLKPTDIEIYEDGVRQQILSFRPPSHELPRAKQADAAQSGKAPAAPAGSLLRPLHAVNLICVVFHNLAPQTRMRAIEAVREFLNSGLDPNAYVGIFTLTDTFSPVFPFTNNHNEVLQAAQNAFSGHTVDFARASEALLTANPNLMTITVAINGSGGGTTASVTAKLTGGEVSSSAIAGAEVSTGAGANAMRGDQVLERVDFRDISGAREMDKINLMINQLGTLPGRKSVLLVSNGFLTTGDPEKWSTMMQKANKAEVTIYTMDTAGLDEYSTVQAGKNALGAVAGTSRTQSEVGGSMSAARARSRQIDTMEDAVRSSDTQATLRTLAEGTGGFMIANTNDYKKPFQKILEDVDAHYEAVYRPASGKFDGHFRKIEVKSVKPDLQIESRAGYFAVPDSKEFSKLEPYEVLGLGALSIQPAAKGFDFRSGFLNYSKAGGSKSGALAFEIPGSSLTATPLPEKRAQQLRLALLALVRDSQGEVVDKYSFEAPFEIADANMAAVRSSAVTYSHPVNLPPGKYSMETAVLDRQGGRASTKVTPFEVPVPRAGIGLSSVTLVQRVEPVAGQADASDPLVFQGKRAVPLLATKLTAEMKPYVYFVVYPDKSNSEKPRIQVEFLVGGQVVAKQGAELPPPDAGGAIPMLVGAALKPGECELRITAMQGSDSDAGSVKYTVAK
jgi:VWFA-related protein